MFAKVDKKGLTATEVKSQKQKSSSELSHMPGKMIFVKLQLIESNRKVAVSYVGNRKSHLPTFFDSYVLMD